MKPIPVATIEAVGVSALMVELFDSIEAQQNAQRPEATGVELAPPVCAPANGETGVCVLVRGTAVAWFATFDEAAEQWCTENHFGEWLTWRASPPKPLPLTEQEAEDCRREADELSAVLNEN